MILRDMRAMLMGFLGIKESSLSIESAGSAPAPSGDAAAAPAPSRNLDYDRAIEVWCRANKVSIPAHALAAKREKLARQRAQESGNVD